jgi:uncharacterized integral membrane protein
MRAEKRRSVLGHAFREEGSRFKARDLLPAKWGVLEGREVPSWAGPGSTNNMRLIYFLFLLLILAAVVVFAYQNEAAMTITFLKWQITSSIALMIAVIYLLGMVSGWTVVGFLKRSFQRVTERRAS